MFQFNCVKINLTQQVAKINIYTFNISMRISGYKNYRPMFLAHTYKVEPKERHVFVQTDNEDNLGENPYFVYYDDGKKTRKKMKKKGQIFYVDRRNIYDPLSYYHIEYKDTGKIDLKNGKDYSYNPVSLAQKASLATRLQYRQPIVHSIKEGKVVGKIKYEDFNLSEKNDDITEPTILVTQRFASALNNPNIVGLIFTTDHIASFSHIGTRLRQETDVCGAIFDSNVIEKLIALDGKNVELEIKDNMINFAQTDKPAKPIEFKTVVVPKLKPCSKILSSKEYTPDIIGAKAVNLRRLEELKEQGKIDVIIPKSMALPSGYLEPFLNGYKANDVNDFIRFYDEYINSGSLDKLINILKANGIDGETIMVRSAFNGEDLPNYSAAGIYRSCYAKMNPERLFESIHFVTNSMHESDAKYSRKLYNIPEENIKPGIILQTRIIPDYKFTLYTDDKKGNLKIEMYSAKGWVQEGCIQPHIFTYNKNTGELFYDSIQMAYPTATFNENEELIDLAPIKYDLSNNKKLFEQLKKVAQNALVVEKEFGHPQDIEGGLKGDDIYFWQTRNIVG